MRSASCMAPASARKPQLHRVDRAAEQVRKRHLLECYERKLRDGLPFERDLDEADGLAVQHRRDERLLRLEHDVELVGLALRQRQETVGPKTGADVVLRPLPHAKRRHRLAGLIERYGIERLEAPVQELLA